jgi:hypothetical protein
MDAKGVAVPRLALISGSGENAVGVAGALRQAGAHVVLASDLTVLEAAVGRLEPGSLDCYIQLPHTVDLVGETVVARVQDFLRRGLLARFSAADLVQPVLSNDATVVLMAGNTPVQGGVAPDDQAARLALLEVLAHAIRADRAPAVIRVRVVDHACPAVEVAELALSGRLPRSKAVDDLLNRQNDMSYADWRVEVMGLAAVQV